METIVVEQDTKTPFFFIYFILGCSIMQLEYKQNTRTAHLRHHSRLPILDGLYMWYPPNTNTSWQLNHPRAFCTLITGLPTQMQLSLILPTSSWEKVLRLVPDIIRIWLCRALNKQQTHPHSSSLAALFCSPPDQYLDCPHHWKNSKLYQALPKAASMLTLQLDITAPKLMVKKSTPRIMQTCQCFKRSWDACVGLLAQLSLATPAFSFLLGSHCFMTPVQIIIHIRMKTCSGMFFTYNFISTLKI